MALLPHAVRADLVVPLPLPRPQRPALEQPQARGATSSSSCSDKTRAVQAVLDGIAAGSGLTIEARDAEPVATAMVVVLTYWLSFEYVRDPRRALEPETRQRRAAARRLPRALPAAALPRRRPARAPAFARRALHDDRPEETDHGQMDRLSSRRRRVPLRRRDAEEEVGAPARRRRRAAAEGREGARRVAALSTPASSRRRPRPG